MKMKAESAVCLSFALSVLLLATCVSSAKYSSKSKSSSGSQRQTYSSQRQTQSYTQRTTQRAYYTTPRYTTQRPAYTTQRAAYTTQRAAYTTQRAAYTGTQRAAYTTPRANAPPAPGWGTHVNQGHSQYPNQAQKYPSQSNYPSPGQYPNQRTGYGQSSYPAPGGVPHQSYPAPGQGYGAQSPYPRQPGYGQSYYPAPGAVPQHYPAPGQGYGGGYMGQSHYPSPGFGGGGYGGYGGQQSSSPGLGSRLASGLATGVGLGVGVGIGTGIVNSVTGGFGSNRHNSNSNSNTNSNTNIERHVEIHNHTQTIIYGDPNQAPGQIPAQNPPGQIPAQNPPGQYTPGGVPVQNPGGQIPVQYPAGQMPAGQNPNDMQNQTQMQDLRGPNPGEMQNQTEAPVWMNPLWQSPNMWTYMSELPVTTSQFSLDVFKKESKSKKGNLIMSPLSVQTMLAMLQQGAANETADQIGKVIHMNPEGSKSALSYVFKGYETQVSKLNIANRIFVNPEFDILPSYEKDLLTNFYSGAEKLTNSGEESAKKINDWVKVSSKNKISEIVKSGDITGDTTLVLANVIHFKSMWLRTFDSAKTVNEEFFTTADSPVNVPMMNQVGLFSSGRDDILKAHWIDMPYDGYAFSMIIVLPTEPHKLDSVIENMTPQHMLAILNAKETKNTVVKMPKFKLNAETSMKSILQELGLTDIFTEKSHLEGIAEKTPLALSEILHNAMIEVNEEGTEAAGVSALQVRALTIRPAFEHLEFKANEPFLAIIVDRVNGLPLFMARVSNPQ